ncbi:MAG: N-acetylmuramoyl-L-alanine amidase [Candidatus Riflebacteria bacterium]|nr:N-acetylmuramoyl-L-alanine amidase [Candidatus Riflebacteria bacterium]
MIRTKLAILFVFLLVATGGFAQSLKPLKGISIMLDPGHGGADPGAVGPTGLKESAVNLRVARYLRDLLRADGAEVSMTRASDDFIALGERVAMATKQVPDLFVSIHHNASLKPRKTNRSEIYYNAIDRGISQKVGNSMVSELAAMGFGEESIIVPAGFFVLRNNPSPSVLTEGGYITIPKIEQSLQTGKALTNQAQALRMAIRESFKDGVLRVKFIVAEDPVKINTSFFNLIFSSNREIEKVNARIIPERASGFGFDRLPSIGNTYRLYNTDPLASGNYELQLTFSSSDGNTSARTILRLQVNLPVANSILTSVAPFIPEGFKGRFPVRITLRDDMKRLNRQPLPITLVYGTNSTNREVTNDTGETTLHLDLNGDEKGSFNVKLLIEGIEYAETNLPVRAPTSRFVLGRVIDASGKGIKNAKISYGADDKTISGTDGYFHLDYPMIYGNMKLSITPPLGYEKTDYWIRTSGEPVTFPIITLKQVAAGLMGKRIAIMAPLSFDNLIRRLVKPLMGAGAEIVRLNFPESQSRPEYQSVLEANLAQNLDVLLSFKREIGGIISVRHYHRGGRGKLLADALKFSMASENPPIIINTEAGSDYEISHTGVTSVVIAFPEQMPPDYPEKLVAHLAQVLKTGF